MTTSVIVKFSLPITWMVCDTWAVYSKWRWGLGVVLQNKTALQRRREGGRGREREREGGGILTTRLQGLNYSTSNSLKHMT